MDALDGMTNLTTGLLAGAFPKTSSSGDGWHRRPPVRRGWPIAVTAVSGPLPLQFPNTNVQRTVLVFQPFNLAKQEKNQSPYLIIASDYDLRNAFRSVVGFVLLHIYQTTFSREFKPKWPE